MKRTMSDTAAADAITPPSHLYVAFDIETTGAYLEKDLCFAVGYCAGYSETDIVEEGKWVMDLSRCLAKALPPNLDARYRSPSDQWKLTWYAAGCEKRGFDEFWSQRLDILERLSDEAQFRLEEDIFYNVNKLLQRLETVGIGRTPEEEADLRAEKQGLKFSLVFDTVAYDTTWLNQRLQKYGYAQLTAKRDGSGYRSAYELDSFRYGLARVRPDAHPEVRKLATAKYISKHRIEGQDYDLQVNAHNIFVDFMACLAACD